MCLAKRIRLSKNLLSKSAPTKKQVLTKQKKVLLTIRKFPTTTLRLRGKCAERGSDLTLAPFPPIIKTVGDFQVRTKRKNMYQMA